jgi:hypothetical protein
MGESCATCPADCGLCETCGNDRCDGTETCSSCPEDCGRCPRCGDGFCTPERGEECLSCPSDCGVCESCGDGMCNMETESCFTCPDDCGVCEGCGDGRCRDPEDCASCSRDCGVCSVCPNMRCETDMFETCANCAADCGECRTIGCAEVLTCVFGCIDFSGGFPPRFSLSCVGTCVATACPDVQFFIDEVLACAVGAIGTCGDIGCIMRECRDSVVACLGARCPPTTM